MSYQILPRQSLGASASFYAKGAVHVVEKKAVDTAKQQLDCSDARITKGKYPDIDDLVVSCCENLKRSGGNAGDKAKGAAACIAKGTAKIAGAAAGAAIFGAICVAAGIATAGATTAASVACAALGSIVGSVVGGWVYDRVSGYNTEQKVAGVIGSVVCGVVTGGATSLVCGLAAAELVGFVEHTLGPIVEGIFDPGAAKERELAARRARIALIDTARHSREKADDAMRALWSQSIGSLKAMYQQSIGSLTPASQAQAASILGFTPMYDSLAKALVAAGAASTPLYWVVDNHGSTIADRIRGNKKNGGPGCESSAEGCLNDGYSEVCPFSFNDFYMEFYNRTNWTGATREQQMGFEARMISQVQIIANGIFEVTQQAISNVATQIATAATLLKHQEELTRAQNHTRAQLSLTATFAAGLAEVAADKALKGNAAEGKTAVAYAQNRYDVAVAAYKLLLDSFGPATNSGQAAARAEACSRDRACKQAGDAVARAKHSADLAVTNATSASHRRTLVGAGAVAGVAGLIYFLWL